MATANKALVFMSKDDLDKAIKAIAKKASSLDHDIQSAGLSCLKHLADHGDIGFVNRLYLALGKGTRKAALSSWFLAYGQLNANTDAATKKEKPFVYTKDKAETNVQGAAQDPWFDHKPDQDPDQVFDLRKAIEAVIKKAAGKTLAHAELLTGLQAMIVADEPAPAAETTPDE